MTDTLLLPLYETENFNKLIVSLKENLSPVLATGVINSQKAHLIHGITENISAPSLIIAENELRAKEIYEDILFFKKDNVMLYPSKDIIFYSADIKSTDIIRKRFEIISEIINAENKGKRDRKSVV